MCERGQLVAFYKAVSRLIPPPKDGLASWLIL